MRPAGTARRTDPVLDMDYVLATLEALLDIRSPSGYTDEIVRWTVNELQRLGLGCELTRRGAIRADIGGEQHSPDRAIVAHLDTVGAMVKDLKPNGRLEILPIGTWSALFALGARVTILTRDGLRRGTILPLKASGHTFGDEVDTQPIAWNHLEVRVDEPVRSAADLARIGVGVGDYVAVDPQMEISGGFINARHLDDKAGAAVLLGAVNALAASGHRPPVDCHLIFTISEEVGSGASHALHGDVAEMVTVDNGTVAPGQHTAEFGVTIAMMDQSGPFDYHLTHDLLGLCATHDIRHARDVFRHYRSDSASAVDAGNDVRTALICFGCDASHGWERVHVDSLRALGDLVLRYVLSAPLPADNERFR